MGGVSAPCDKCGCPGHAPPAPVPTFAELAERVRRLEVFAAWERSGVSTDAQRRAMNAAYEPFWALAERLKADADGDRPAR